MAKSKYPKGFKATVYATIGRYPGDVKTCEALGGFFKEIGIKATCRTMPYSAWKKKRKSYQKGKGKGEAAVFVQGYGNSGGDPGNIAPATGGCKGHSSVHCFKDLDVQIDKAKFTADPKQQQIEFEKDSFKNKLGIIRKYEEENKNLSLKLKQEYEKNKEIIILKNKISLFETSKKDDDKVISELKKKLNSVELEDEEGITLNIVDNNDNLSEEEGIKDIDYDEIYQKTLEAENSRNINLQKYKNDKLKSIISKHVIDKNDYIDDIFIKFKINQTTVITKDLISRIIFELKQ